MTFDFKQVVIYLDSVEEFKDEEHQIESEIHYEKTISFFFNICYNFKYSTIKHLKIRGSLTYYLILYHRGKSNDPYHLYLSSTIDYKLNTAKYKPLQIYGN